MKLARRASAAGIAALVVLFAASCAHLWMQRRPVDAGVDVSPIQTGRIVVWISARTGNYSRAVAASFAAEFPKADLVERNIPQADFVGRVRSKSQDDPPPDVAFIDNYRELQPLLESKVVLSAWGTSRFPTHGWWVIFKDTPHLEQAKAFVRWLHRAPGWQPSAANDALSRQARETVHKAAIAAFHAMMSGDHARLEVLLDKDAARRRFAPIDASSRLSNVTPILTFGNARIAFVILSAVGSGDSFYGLRQILFIFRNEGDGWRILQMDPNARGPISLNPPRGIGLPPCDGSSPSSCLRVDHSLPPLLGDFDRHILREGADSPPQSAVLIDPADRAVLPRWPERPEIAWRSDGPPDSTFIVESQYWDPEGEGNWSVSGLTFADRALSGQPFRQRAPFGVGMQPHRWRIWTLVPSGAVAVSAWRTILFSN
jgi:hypothetical protein